MRKRLYQATLLAMIAAIAVGYCHLSAKDQKQGQKDRPPLEQAKTAGQSINQQAATPNINGTYGPASMPGPRTPPPVNQQPRNFSYVLDLGNGRRDRVNVFQKNGTWDGVQE